MDEWVIEDLCLIFPTKALLHEDRGGLCLKKLTIIYDDVLILITISLPGINKINKEQKVY